MKDQLSDAEIVELYVEYTNFGFVYRSIVYCILICFAMINMYKLLTFGSEPDTTGMSANDLLIFPTLVIIVIGNIKHWYAISSDSRLLRMLWSPILSFRCIMNVIRPSEEDKIRFRYFETFYRVSAGFFAITCISIFVFFMAMILSRFMG